MKKLIIAALLSLTALSVSVAFAEDTNQNQGINQAADQNSDNGQNVGCSIWPFC